MSVNYVPVGFKGFFTNYSLFKVHVYSTSLPTRRIGPSSVVEEGAVAMS